jgi:hypothetical protein
MAGERPRFRPPVCGALRFSSFRARAAGAVAEPVVGPAARVLFSTFLESKQTVL